VISEGAREKLPSGQNRTGLGQAPEDGRPGHPPVRVAPKRARMRTVQDLLKWLHERNWDAGASVLGVFVTIIGFAVTLIQVARSKSAAQRAEEAVAGVREDLALQSVATDLTALMADIEEMKQLHRLGYWNIMPIRYAGVRRKLIEVRASCPNLTRTQKSSILGIIEQFKDIEQLVEEAIANNEPPKDVAAINKLSSDQADKLSEVLVAVQQELRER
jgi:hypothetical protein